MSACHICGRHHELPEERLRAEVERLREMIEVALHAPNWREILQRALARAHEHRWFTLTERQERCDGCGETRLAPEVKG